MRSSMVRNFSPPRAAIASSITFFARASVCPKETLASASINAKYFMDLLLLRGRALWRSGRERREGRGSRLPADFFFGDTRVELVLGDRRFGHFLAVLR